MVYQYINNYEKFKVPAQIVGETLERLEQRDGEVTKESFLEESRPETAPTHKLFEWNDTVAAEKYRLHQSGMAIKAVAVKVETADSKEPTVIRAFVNIQPDRITKGKFINIFAGMNNEETRKTILANAMAELRQFERKYSLYEEFSKVCAAINELKEVS